MAQRKRRGSTKRQRTAEELHREELHDQQMSEDAVVRTEKVEQRVQKLQFLLRAALSRDLNPLDFEQLKKPMPSVDLGADAHPLPLPRWEEYAPVARTLLRSRTLLRRLRGRTPLRDATEAEAEEAYAKALERYRNDEAARLRRVEDMRRTHDDARATDMQRTLEHNASIDAFRGRVVAADREAVTDYFTRIFAQIVDRPTLPRERRLAYVPESRLLLVEWQLPGTDIVPREKEYRYHKQSDSIGVYKWRSIAEVRDIYHDLVAQLALRAAHVAFATDPAALLDTVVFNGVVPGADDTEPCLISMSTSRKHFGRLNLDGLADPSDLVRRHCGGEVSAYPDELAAIRTVLSYDLADPTVPLTSSSRAPDLQNTPIEAFHRLMERLLERMGYTVVPLDKAPGTYVATAKDPDPAERSVVHVRRSTAPLDVAEVRALQSDVRHQRAASGLLFTTSGLGPQAYEYAHGRPLRMFDGHSVVALCRQHDLPARIEAAPAPAVDKPEADHERAVPEQRHDRAPSNVDG